MNDSKLEKRELSSRTKLALLTTFVICMVWWCLQILSNESIVPLVSVLIALIVYVVIDVRLDSKRGSFDRYLIGVAVFGLCLAVPATFAIPDPWDPNDILVSAQKTSIETPVFVSIPFWRPVHSVDLRYERVIRVMARRGNADLEHVLEIEVDLNKDPELARRMARRAFQHDFWSGFDKRFQGCLKVKLETGLYSGLDLTFPRALNENAESCLSATLLASGFREGDRKRSSIHTQTSQLTVTYE